MYNCKRDIVTSKEATMNANMNLKYNAEKQLVVVTKFLK